MELTSYELQDFVPFGREVFLRLFVRHNEALWPAQILALLAGAAAVVLALRRRGRWVGTILGVAWIAVGLLFHLLLFAELLWAADWFGGIFVAQGALLILWGWLGRLDPPPVTHGPGRFGVGLALVALVGHPLLAPLAGRSLTGAEVFGLAPDPTAVLTLGLLLTTPRPRWLLFVVPILWCAVAGALAWVVDLWTGLVPPAAALLAVVAAAWRHWSGSVGGQSSR